MRHQKILPALLLSAAALLATRASAQTYPWAKVATVPAAPAPGDHVVLALSGEWTDTCGPTAEQASVKRNGNTLAVDIVYGGYGVGCGAAISPFHLDVAAGTLPEGSYTVAVTLTLPFSRPISIGTGAFVVAEPPTTHFWIPAFSARSDGYRLASNLTSFNGGEGAGEVVTLAAYDALGERDPGRAPVAIAPQGASLVPTAPLRSGQPVEMLSLSAPAAFAFRATLERLEDVPDGAPKVPASYGRVELPIFTALVPAGSTALAGDVSLTSAECSGPAESRRRVNLTIFNAGDEQGTFTVAGTAVSAGPGGSGGSETYSVPARSLVQFNALPIDAFPVCQPGGAWFRITGNQPFLAYVSTARPQTLPGILPYEIFPARLAR